MARKKKAKPTEDARPDAPSLYVEVVAPDPTPAKAKEWRDAWRLIFALARSRRPCRNRETAA